VSTKAKAKVEDQPSLVEEGWGGVQMQVEDSEPDNNHKRPIKERFILMIEAEVKDVFGIGKEDMLSSYCGLCEVPSFIVVNTMLLYLSFFLPLSCSCGQCVNLPIFHIVGDDLVYCTTKNKFIPCLTLELICEPYGTNHRDKVPIQVGGWENWSYPLIDPLL